MVNLDSALERFDLRGWLETTGFDNKGRSDEYLHDCPYCGGEDKFSINPVNRKWRCFVCRVPARLLDIIAEFEGSYHIAVKLVLDSTRVTLQSLPPLKAEAPPSKILRPENWEPEVISPPQSFQLLTQHLPYTRKRRWPLEHLQLLGVGYCTDGRYQDRIVFPVRRADGQWIYFQARAMWDSADNLGTKYRKVLNPEGEGDATGASDVLLGLIEALPYVRAGHRLAVVEGPTDWVMAAPAATGLLGKVISPMQLRLFAQYQIKAVDLILDPDAWKPREVTFKDGTTRTLPPTAPAVMNSIASVVPDVRIVMLPDGTDPGAYDPGMLWEWRKTGRPHGSISRLQRL